MLGDRIVVKPHHTKAAEGVYEKVCGKVTGSEGSLAMTVAGESGSGKSEIASEIARLFSQRESLKCVIFHQDDYFIRPPKTNDKARLDDIGNVGTHEVLLDLMNEHILLAKDPGTGTVVKPLIDYDNDRVLEEETDVSGVNLVIAEGTYTTSLKDADIRVFIDRTYHDTLEHRKERGRDELNEYTEKILVIEHEIISSHKKEADIVIGRDYRVV